MPASNLRQSTTAYKFVGEGKWIDGSILTNPTDGTLIVDTGQLPAGDYWFAIHGETSTDEAIEVQLRDAANSTNVKRQRRRPRTGDIDWIFPNKITVALNQRLRVIQVGNMTGEVQISIFYQEVEPYLP